VLGEGNKAGKTGDLETGEQHKVSFSLDSCADMAHAGDARCPHAAQPPLGQQRRSRSPDSPAALGHSPLGSHRQPSEAS